jgi:hypothetical protein
MAESVFRQAGRMYDSVHYLNAQSRATEYSLGLQQRAMFLRVSSRFHAHPSSTTLSDRTI